MIKFGLSGVDATVSFGEFLKAVIGGVAIVALPLLLKVLLIALMGV
jgi:hypothetical protein